MIVSVTTSAGNVLYLEKYVADMDGERFSFTFDRRFALDVPGRKILTFCRWISDVCSTPDFSPVVKAERGFDDD